MHVSQNSKVKQRTIIYLFLGHKWYYLRFCVDELFWLIVSFRIVVGVNRLVIVIASE